LLNLLKKELDLLLMPFLIDYFLPVHSAYLSLVVLYDVFVHAFSVAMQVYLTTLCHSYAYEVEWETILLYAYEQKHVFLVIFVGPFHDSRFAAYELVPFD